MRPGVLSTTEGTHRGAFTPLDWGLFASIGGIWGSSFLFIAIGLESFGPGAVTWLRVLIGAAVLWTMPSARVPLEPGDRFRLLTISVLWVAIPFTLLPLAEQRITSALTGLLNGALPIFATTIGAVMLRRLPGRTHAIGLLTGFAGVALIALPAAGAGSSEAAGVAFALAAVLCYGFASNIATPLTQRYGALPTMARMLALAAIWTAPFGVWDLRNSSFEWGPALAIAALGALGTGLAFVIMGTLVARVGASRAAFAIYLVPVVAMILGAVFLDESILAISVAGIALVLIGAFLASRRDTARAP